MVPDGIRVIEVDESTDAYEKLLPGDIVLTIDGNYAGDAKNIDAALEVKAAGDTVTLEVFRVTDGKEENLTLEIELSEDLLWVVSNE